MAFNTYTRINDVEIPSINDAVADAYNCAITVLVVDMRNSTGQKFVKSAIAWNSEFLKTHQVLEKFLTEMTEMGIAYATSFGGDGITVVIDTSSGAHHLINMAIGVLEDIDELSTARNGAPMGQIDLKLSAAIATGEGYRFRPDHGGIEHLSAAIDRASRLCSVASPGALFIDTATSNSANLQEVTSRFGRYMRREPDDYLGERQRVQLRGLPGPQDYFEINWGTQLFGVRSATVTEISSGISPSSEPAAVTAPMSGHTAPTSSAAEQFHGTVTHWNSAREFGFVRDSATGEEFYFGTKSLIYGDDRRHLKAGVELVFGAGGSAADDRKRLAAPVLVVGHQADGRVSYVHPEKPFGFIAVVDDRGRTLKFHMALSPEAKFRRDDEVSFTVSTNARGARALEVDHLDEPGGHAAA